MESKGLEMGQHGESGVLTFFPESGVLTYFPSQCVFMARIVLNWQGEKS